MRDFCYQGNSKNSQFASLTHVERSDWLCSACNQDTPLWTRRSIANAQTAKITKIANAAQAMQMVIAILGRAVLVC